jgi:hypothetical protein
MAAPFKVHKVSREFKVRLVWAAPKDRLVCKERLELLAPKARKGLKVLLV